MSVIGPCDVYLNDGRVIENEMVLFKDNGWIRIGEEYYQYMPPQKIKCIDKDDR